MKLARILPFEQEKRRAQRSELRLALKLSRPSPTLARIRFSFPKARLAHVETGLHETLVALNGVLIERTGGLRFNHLTEFTKFLTRVEFEKF